MKRMAAVLAALGMTCAAYAHDSSDLTRMEEQSYDSLASSDAEYWGDPSDDAYVVEEYILVPSDSVVLIPLDDEEDPG